MSSGGGGRSPVLAAALHAAARGWAVFPLTPGGKFPIIAAAHPQGHPCRGECGRAGHGFHDASTDPDVIGGWWRRWPRANYGISTGPAGLVVIDLDTAKGDPPSRVLPDQGTGEARPGGVRDGADVLAWAADRDGAAIDWDTFTVGTPSGGLHLFHTAPPGVVVRGSVGCTAGRVTGLGWCVDVRAHGGYVVGPGSRGPRQGPGYAPLVKGAPVRPLPEFLAARIAALTATPPCIPAKGGRGVGGGGGPRIGPGYLAAALRGELAHIAAATPGDTGGGGRNVSVNRAAYKVGRLITAHDLDDTDVAVITAELLTAATRTGLSEREANTAVASGLAQGRAHPRPVTRAS